MTIDDFIYFDKYKRNLNKFIFKEGSNLTEAEYIGLTDEVRNIDAYLKKHEKILSKQIRI